MRHAQESSARRSVLQVILDGSELPVDLAITDTDRTRNHRWIRGRGTSVSEGWVKDLQHRYQSVTLPGSQAPFLNRLPMAKKQENP